MYLHEKQQLKNKVHQENEVRKVINQVAPLVADELKSFVGVKFLKADDYPVKKFCDKVDFLNNLRNSIKVQPIEGQKHASIQCLYVNATKYSVQLKVSICFSQGDHGCIYAEDVVYLADIQNSLMGKAGDGSIEKMLDFTPRTMLSAAQEWKTYEKAAKAKDTLEKAKNAMWYGLRSWV
jgi:hypothetical protein